MYEKNTFKKYYSRVKYFGYKLWNQTSVTT